ncbi:hypothetical protein PHISP_05985 [Aspergillus sp. HF37]|nr:hypothetical protein PHISP_05985 [Aspergillus sp. HF37]
MCCPPSGIAPRAAFASYCRPGETPIQAAGRWHREKEQREAANPPSETSSLDSQSETSMQMPEKAPAVSATPEKPRRSSGGKCRRFLRKCLP